jgi:hypothetical protein
LLLIVAGWFIIPGARNSAVYGDELRTWRDSVRETWGTIFNWRHNKDHAPLSYLLVKLTTTISGDERGWVMRIPSVICGLLCIPAAFWLGKVVWSNALGLIAAALVTVDVSVIWQAQQARMYPMMLLFLLIGLVQIVKLAASGGRPRWRWVLLGVILGIGMWTHAQSSALLVALIALTVTLLLSKHHPVRAVPVESATADPGGQSASQKWLDYEKPDPTNGPPTLLPARFRYILVSALIALGIGLLMMWPALNRFKEISERDEIDAPVSLESVPKQFKVLARELTGRRDVSILLGLMMVGGLVALAVQHPSKRPAAVALLAVGVFSVAVLMVVAHFRPVHGARYIMSAVPAAIVGIGWCVLLAFRSPYTGVRIGMALLLATHLGAQGYRCTQASMIAGTHQYADEFAKASRWLRRMVTKEDQVLCIPQVPGLYRSYYRFSTTPGMDTDMRKLLAASQAARREVWAGRKRKWTRRVTYVLAISPPEAAQRETGADPRRVIPLLAQLYDVPVRTRGILPDKKPMRVFIYKISKKGSWVYDAQGNLLASNKPTSRPATQTTATTRPTRQAATRPASRRAR